MAAITAIATIFSWLSLFFPRGPWNALFWIGTSITIAHLGNKGAARLLYAPVLALVFLAALVGNEAAAHLVFGYCLLD